MCDGQTGSWPGRDSGMYPSPLTKYVGKSLDLHRPLSSLTPHTHSVGTVVLVTRLKGKYKWICPCWSALLRGQEHGGIVTDPVCTAYTHSFSLAIPFALPFH